MFTENLYKDILIEPAKKGGTDLYVVSGYATSGMVSRHLEDICKLEKINIHLIVGMVGKDGISRTNHQGFCHLVNNPEIGFRCSYILENTPKQVHSKAYAWFNNDLPVDGFIGSANYTQNGFFKQQEAMEKSSPEEILKYYNELENMSCSCLHSDVDGLVKDQINILQNNDAGDSSITHREGSESVTYTLLDRDENLPKSSGLNWGHRGDDKNYKREPNQAYIRVPADVTKKEFFPERGNHFALHTDDGHTFLCAITQDGGKAIHSTDNNSLLGEYFRNRIGVPLGSLVTRQDLENYGRTDITFYQIDDENYLMNFAVDNKSI